MVDYISGDELATMIKSDKVPWKDYVVVDVRDDDWIGGNIKGSANVPSRSFSSRVDKLVHDTKDIPTLVFHCVMSQCRGPMAARSYKEARTRIINDRDNTLPKILILRGGFEQFQAKFKHDGELVENWDARVWLDEF